MKILVVTQYFWPEQFRINDICEELSRRGHEVTVLTGLPNYPAGEIFEGYENAWAHEEKACAARIIRSRMRPRHKGTLNLVRNYLSFAWNASRMASRLDDGFDIVYVYGLSPITSSLPAIAYKRRYGVPIVHYCCDLWPESVLGEQNGHGQISRSNPIYLASKALSRYVYRSMDIVACKCSEFADYLQKVCSIPATKTTVLYEHAEDSYLEVDATPIDNGVIDFMFLGNMGAVQNCDQILEATSKLIPTSPFIVHFVGDGSSADELKQMSHDLGLDEVVVFHGRCPVSKVNRYYKLADICLLTLSNRTATGLTPPAKLAGYMAAARPVIASINGAARTIIEEAGCGMAVGADDVDGLRSLMQKVLNQPERVSGMGANGRRYFLDHLTLEKHVDSLERLFRELTSNVGMKLEDM